VYNVRHTLTSPNSPNSDRRRSLSRSPEAKLVTTIVVFVAVVVLGGVLDCTDRGGLGCLLVEVCLDEEP
jgi:hypothetical protein